MEVNQYMWCKTGYLGNNILCSNNKSSLSKIIFGGASKLDQDENWRLNFIFVEGYLGKNKGNFYSSNMEVKVKKGDKIRFENYLGITEKINVEYSAGDDRSYSRFFPVKYIKILSIQTDSIRYEVHCK
ncbi:hypothetical protein [Dethiothermospora halolimnae]|uniref:hypothetical protein n=1 Tax=Dethiothermospora halolimnae TaxID=3114390 RepID=UPI003CCBF8AE